jgi:AAA domain, putative AbiEii toxin, Type IV TA system
MLLSAIAFSGGESVPATPVTLIIGPNNVGKSRALRELSELFSMQKLAAEQHRVISRIELAPPSSWTELNSSFMYVPPTVNSGMHRQVLTSQLNGIISIGIGDENGYHGFSPSDVYLANYGAASIAYLATQQRLGLLGTATMIPPPPLGAPANVTQWLFHRRDLEEQVNVELYREFRTRIHADWSNLTQILIRVGPDVTEMPADPFEAAPLAARFETIESQGDGFRSYAATVAALTVARRPVTLIDEPETSLHPPQAISMGRYFGKSFDASHQLVAATHSADLLRGVLSTATQLTLIRLTRKGDKNHAVSISADELRAIANDPLLNASSILDAVFFSGAVVTEADADRAFYEEISIRLDPSESIRFTSVQGKHTISRAIRAYRRMGVAHAAITDIDALREDNAFTTLVSSATDDPDLQVHIAEMRRAFIANIAQPTADERLTLMTRIVWEMQGVLATEAPVLEKVNALKKLGPRLTREADPWKRLKEGGVQNMNCDEASAFELLREALCSIGIFIVPVGELEWWLTCVGIEGTSDKRAWITTALQQARALEPRQDVGPWAFMHTIHRHLSDD